MRVESSFQPGPLEGSIGSRDGLMVGSSCNTAPPGQGSPAPYDRPRGEWYLRGPGGQNGTRSFPACVLSREKLNSEAPSCSAAADSAGAPPPGRISGMVRPVQPLAPVKQYELMETHHPHERCGPG